MSPTLIPPWGICQAINFVIILPMPNLWLVFTTGLLTGGVTCLAVQGGLLTASLAAAGKSDNTRPLARAFPTLAFLTAKLVAYILLGALLGLVGTAIQPTPIFRAIFQGL